MKKFLAPILFLISTLTITADLDSDSDYEIEVSSPYILQISMPGYRATYEVPTNLIESIRGKIRDLHNKRHLYSQDVEALLIILQPNDSSRMASTKFSSMFLEDLVDGLNEINNGSYF